MNTVFISEEEVRGYLRDFIARLSQLDKGVPRVWCPIGPSGLRLAQVAMQLDADLASQTQVVPIVFDRSNSTVSFSNDRCPEEVVKGRSILLVDGSVHSARTISRAYAVLESLGPSDISSYSLVVRSGASMVPNFFGLLVGDHDRVHFLKQEIPNNRLLPFGRVRTLAFEDLDKPMVQTGEHFIDKFTWSDLWYEMRADRRRKTYLYERTGEIQGFVSFRVGKARGVLVDTLGVGRQHQRQGIAGALLRWVETLGRHRRCRSLSLWGVEQRREWYENRGFQARGSQMVLDGVKFYMMRKKLLYSLPDDELIC